MFSGVMMVGNVAYFVLACGERRGGMIVKVVFFFRRWHEDTFFIFFFFSSRRRHTRSDRDWSSDVCSSDLGLSNAEIGERLVIAEATVKTHLLRIFAKLDVTDRTRAVVVALDQGLLRRP